ncbi:MAG: hypothetical protein KBS62_08195 [Oscillospiraceae bacterium]|nr:hypothetical protein [Candidatus Ruminococcus equi]
MLIYKPIFHKLTGGACNDYITYTISLNGSVVYNGRAFTDISGSADIRIDEIIKDFSFNWKDQFKYNTSTQRFSPNAVSYDPMIEVKVNNTIIGTIDASRKLTLDDTSDFDTTKIPTPHIALGMPDFHLTTDMYNDCVIDDNCDLKPYYITFIHPSVGFYKYGFTAAQHTRTAERSIVSDLRGFDNVIHSGNDDILTLTTGMLTKDMYSFLSYLPYSDIVYVWDTNTGAGDLYHVDTTQLSGVNSGKISARDLQHTFTFKKIVNTRI